MEFCRRRPEYVISSLSPEFAPAAGRESLAVGVTAWWLCLLVTATGSNGEPPRRPPNRRAEIEQQRQDLLDRTNREVDEMWRQYQYGFCRESQTSVGAIYARYSTRHQDSFRPWPGKHWGFSLRRPPAPGIWPSTSSLNRPGLSSLKSRSDGIRRTCWARKPPR